MFIEINNFLNEQSCNEIIRRCSAFIDKNKVDIEYNRQGNSVNTRDYEELKDLDKKIFDRINLFVTKRLVYSFNLGNSKMKDTGYSFHRYEKGDQLYTHADGVFSHEKDEIFNPRVLALVVNLTNNQNADLIFPRHNKAIKSEKGKLVAFLPHHCYEHYMNNKSDSNRDVLVTWLVDETIECKKIKDGKKNI
jgi:hypothetical protein|tara:strand:+ start:353 stop:928 length:576 start_codon:yes stop_codon:yes gene_type:complete